ncbi:nuclear transport factor 2 family protein [Flindersiella endophytica]
MKLAETLIELENDMWRANREGDGAFYATALRDDALVVSKYGVMGKDQIVPVIQANRNPYVKTDLSEHRVIELDANNAVLTYHAHVVAEVQGKEVELPSYATSVYTREGDGWRIVFHQQTAL